MFFPVRWTDRGIVYHPSPPAARGVSRDPLLTTDVDAIVLRWADVWSMALVEPWPQAVIRWPGGEIALGPKGLFDPKPEAFAAEVERLVAHLEEHAPAKVSDRGWLDVPEEPWERVRALPDLASDAILGDGAFRSAPRPVEEPVVAARGPATPFEAMLGWLASSPERPWREHPRQVRLTDAYVYVERRDRSVWRIPLDALRARRGERDRDAIYVLGRRTPLILTHRPDCAVRAALDARLTSR